VHRRLSPYHAVRFYDRIAEFDPFYLKKPCLADNVDLLVQAKRHIPALW
jgi:L-alanine-DL-glutamate epimerase-like enolase superfamily enzyme